MMTLPTVTEIRTQIISDMETAIGTTIPIAPKAFIRVLATVLAGALVLAYRFGAWGYHQIFAASADEEALTRRAEEYGLSRNPAVAAVLVVTAYGTDGTTIPEGTLWATNKGIVYEQEDDATIATGEAVLSLIALEGGEVGNQDNDTVLYIASPLAGTSGTAAVTGITVTGEDAEALGDFRTRILERIRFRPGVGSAVDYIRSAREVPGIVRAFAFNSAPGEVSIYPLQATAGSSRIPSAGKITEVENYINDTSRKPLCATVIAVAMTEVAVDLQMSALVPDSPALRTTIEAAIQEYLWTRYPRQYTDDIPANIISLAALYGITAESGAQSITIVSSSMGAGFTLSDNELAKLGAVTWS